MNKRHSNSTTTIQLHLTTADYQRIHQDLASEFFLNKTTRIYARGPQKERYTVLSNNSDSRPSNFLSQIARGSGATLSECPFFKKAHITQKNSSRQQFSNNIRFKTLQLFVPNSKRLGGYTQWVHFFLLQKAHVTRETSSRQTTSRPHDKKNPDLLYPSSFL